MHAKTALQIVPEGYQLGILGAEVTHLVLGFCERQIYTGHGFGQQHELGRAASVPEPQHAGLGEPVHVRVCHLERLGSGVAHGGAGVYFVDAGSIAQEVELGLISGQIEHHAGLNLG